MSYRKHLMTSDEPPSELYKAVELDTNLAEVGTDCISRQAVLDALNNIEIPRNASWYQYYQQALTAVDKLPPAQPEIIRCNDCKHRDPEDKKCDCGHDIEWQLPRQDDWFCADAERRATT